jgi:hypothetical protein
MCKNINTWYTQPPKLMCVLKSIHNLKMWLWCAKPMSEDKHVETMQAENKTLISGWLSLLLLVPALKPNVLYNAYCQLSVLSTCLPFSICNMQWQLSSTLHHSSSNGSHHIFNSLFWCGCPTASQTNVHARLVTATLSSCSSCWSYWIMDPSY